MTDLAPQPKSRIKTRGPKPAALKTGRAVKPEPFRIPRADLWPIVINVIFGLLGLALMFHDFSVGLVTAAFFGSGGFFLGWLQWKRYEDHRLMLTSVEVAGGVRIWPRRGFLFTMGAWSGAVGTIMYVFGDSYPDLFRWLAIFIAASGFLLAALAWLRLFPGGFLQFEPEGLIIAKRGWQMLIPWDKVDNVSTGELQNNPYVHVWVVDRAALVFTPDSAKVKAEKALASSSIWQWNPLVIFPMHFGIPTTILAAAIVRYATDAKSRAALASRRLPSS
jgi:hypothetical protein